VALGIKITQLVPLYPHRIYFQWDLINPTEPGTYLFQIERAGSSDGPWEMLEASYQNGYNYIDDLRHQPQLPDNGNVNTYGLDKQIYYRVTVIPPSGCQNGAQTEPHGLYKTLLPPVQAGLRRRLLHDERIVLRSHNGVPLVLLKRRRWGTRCPVCYDDLTRAVTRESCPTCYGTSFVGGYWTGIRAWGRIYPPENLEKRTAPQQKIEHQMHRIQLLDIPLLQDDDLIVELDTNDRYLVERNKLTEIRRKPVHQEVDCAMLARSAVEYTLLVDPRTIPSLF
jgi:hypothetical protein